MDLHILQVTVVPVSFFVKYLRTLVTLILCRAAALVTCRQSCCPAGMTILRPAAITVSEVSKVWLTAVFIHDQQILGSNILERRDAQNVYSTFNTN